MKLSRCGRHLAFTLDAGTGEETLQVGAVGAGLCTLSSTGGVGDDAGGQAQQVRTLRSCVGPPASESVANARKRAALTEHWLLCPRAARQAFTRDLSNGTLRHLSALGGVTSLEWSAGGRSLLAAQPNELGRPWRVVAVDTPAGDSSAGGGSGGGVRGSARWGSGGGAVLWEEPDERFFVELGRTKDWG